MSPVAACMLDVVGRLLCRLTAGEVVY